MKISRDKLFDHFKNIRTFLNAYPIKNSFGYLPPQTFTLSEDYDQNVVNKFMQLIVTERVSSPIIATFKGRIVVDGHNLLEAYLQLNKMTPVLLIDVKDADEYHKILSEYNEWCQQGGNNALTIDQWISGISTLKRGLDYD